MSQEIRKTYVTNEVSNVAKIPELRTYLVKKQKELGKHKGVIMDGRDIGSVVFPNADFKFFIDASIDIRAKRRLLEKNISFLHENDEKCMLQTLINDMRKRDRLDSNRKVSPLVPAKDAYVIDTSLINAQELLSLVTSIIEGKNNC